MRRLSNCIATECDTLSLSPPVLEEERVNKKAEDKELMT